MSTYTLPACFKSWHEFYHRLMHQFQREGTQWNDDTELTMEFSSYEFGPLMCFNEIEPGFTIRDLKVLAFDEIQKNMPTDRRRLFDEVHRQRDPDEGSPVRWLDQLIREKNLSTFSHEQR